MYVAWKKLKNFDLLAPCAWFNLEEDALEYAEYLATIGVECEVVYAPEQSIAGDDVAPEGWGVSK